MSGTLLHMPTIPFPTFMIFSLALFSYPPDVIFQIKVQDSFFFFSRPSNSKDLVLFPINETSVFQVVVLIPQKLSWWRVGLDDAFSVNSKFNMSCNAYMILNHIINLCNFKIKH